MRCAATVLLWMILLPAAGLALGRSEPAAAGGTTTTLRVAWWGSQARHERTIAALALFQRENPGISIDYDYAIWNDYWTKLTTMAAGDNLPDVIQQDYQYLTEWVDRGLIVPLDSYLRADLLDLSDVAESAVGGGRSNGGLYGIVLGINSACMMLDAAAFGRAGVPLPPDDWTWADFERIALALTRALGMPAVSGNIVHDHIWRSMYLGKGLWVYSKDGASLGYPPSEDALFAGQLRLARRLLDAGAMIPYSEIVAGRSRVIEDDWIVKGRSAITFAWSNQVVAAWTAAGVDARQFVLKPLPRIARSAGSSNYMKPAMLLSISRNSRSPAAASKLIDFFTNSIDANRILLAERGVPIAAKVREALKPLMPLPQRVVFDYLDRIQKDVAPVPPPDPVGNTDLINNVFIPMVVDPVMFGVIPPEEGMKRLRAEAQRILRQ